MGRSSWARRYWVTCPVCGRRVGRYEWLFAPDSDAAAFGDGAEEFEAWRRERDKRPGSLPPQVLVIVELASGADEGDRPGELSCPRGHYVTTEALLAGAAVGEPGDWHDPDNWRIPGDTRS